MRPEIGLIRRAFIVMAAAYPLLLSGLVAAASSRWRGDCVGTAIHYVWYHVSIVIVVAGRTPTVTIHALGSNPRVPRGPGSSAWEKNQGHHSNADSYSQERAKSS